VRSLIKTTHKSKRDFSHVFEMQKEETEATESMFQKAKEKTQSKKDRGAKTQGRSG